ncbi:class I SAM-dependent methyltransferase [Candidatus Sororendozoicomonas aggregata]|uniref:class I SAM-dependent methyltransferase n=1 Tax=Candidatus Sororendozoicomonas aggregata TaxID=3073239 RepID=UPI002ED6A83A
MTTHVFSNPSQLILRNSEVIQARRLLVLAPPVDALGTALLEQGCAREVIGLTPDYAAYYRLCPVWGRNGRRQRLVYGTDLTAKQEKPFDGVLIFLKKSKPLMDFWLDYVVTILAPDARVWLVGENNEGIKSWRKRLMRHFPDVVSLDSARHCGLLEASGQQEVVPVFQRDSYWQHYPVRAGGKTFNSYSLPGVFSHGRLDKGTAVLLETFGQFSARRILDFGCGAGIISAALGQLQPESHFTLVDSDALALASSERTLFENGLNNVEVLPSDGLQAVKGTFDLIVSNPPFHQGVKTHYDVTEQFLAQSKKHLNRGGELRVVANSFLRYEPIIVSTFGVCETMLTKDGFSVYRACF